MPWGTRAREFLSYFGFDLERNMRDNNSQTSTVEHGTHLYDRSTRQRGVCPPTVRFTLHFASKARLAVRLKLDPKGGE